MKNDIKNSSGKVIGYTIIDMDVDTITIHNNTKPELLIQNKELINNIINNQKVEETLQQLYDEYLLGCGEIASLYGVCYSNINKRLKEVPLMTSPKAGRRNRSYGKEQSQKVKENISLGVKKAYKEGKYDDVQPYERTEEIKKKISSSLKLYYKNHPENPEPHRRNWKNGVYNNVDFKRGIAGFFFSIKNNKDFYFRSLLELYYMLQLEKDCNVTSYSYESLRITCDNGHIYTPDIIYDNVVVELKPKKYIEKNPIAKETLLYKMEQGKKYCDAKGLVYKVVFDEDIGFDSKNMKRYLNNHPEVIKEYNIRFNDKKRMVIK